MTAGVYRSDLLVYWLMPVGLLLREPLCDVLPLCDVDEPLPVDELRPVDECWAVVRLDEVFCAVDLGVDLAVDLL